MFLSQQVIRHPDAHRLDMKNFTNRPIPRLSVRIVTQRYPRWDSKGDREAIPQVLDVIKALGKKTEPGVESAKQKVQLWNYNANLVFKPGEVIVRVIVAFPWTISHTLAGYGLAWWTSIFNSRWQTVASTGHRFRMERLERAVCFTFRQLL